MTNTISLKELRPELPRVIKSIDEKFDRFVITKRGKPVVVMMSIEEYESWEETLEILSDKETMKRIRKGEAEIKAGKTISLEEMKRLHGEI